MSLPPSCSHDKLLLLWEHECDWIYGHRMVNDVDYQRFRHAFITAVKKDFVDDDEVRVQTYTHYLEIEDNVLIMPILPDQPVNQMTKLNGKPLKQFFRCYIRSYDFRFKTFDPLRNDFFASLTNMIAPTS